MRHEKLYAKLEALDAKDRPYMSRYPALAEWVHAHEGRCMTQDLIDDGGDGERLAFVERWLIGKGICVIWVRSHGGGWDIYTACSGIRVDETLVDAERRLGLVKPKKMIKMMLGGVEVEVEAADEE